MSKRDKPSISVRAAKGTGRAAFAIGKMTGKLGWAIAKPIGKTVGKLAIKGGLAAKEQANIKISEQMLRQAKFNQENFYEKGSAVLEDLVDALLNQQSGTAARVVKALSAKLGAAGATAGIFSIASILGTASTGTAISSLSGAAFSNAALAWVGGTVAAGGWIVLGVATLGAAAAYFGSRHVVSKWTGKRRKQKALDAQEARLVETCLMLATAFRERTRQKAVLDRTSAEALHQNLSGELIEQVDDCIAKVDDWPKQPLSRLKNCRMKLGELLGALIKLDAKVLPDRRQSIAGAPILTGIVSASIMKLMASEVQYFSDEKQLVLQALRRSNNSLSEASADDLSNYVQALTIEQVSGLKNNVKGIYHELAFQRRENMDGDEYIVELFNNTNHAGADVRIINVLTGDVSEVQLKATNYASYVRDHNEKYENIDVLTTSEVASSSPDWSSSGFNNEDLTADTASTLDMLDQGAASNIAESMGVAAMVTLSTNAKSMLKGETLSIEAKQKIIQDGVVAASVAGLVQLIL